MLAQLLCLAIALAPTKSQAAIALRHAYAIQNRAYATKDVAAFLATTTPDYRMRHREHGAKLDNDRSLVEGEMRSTFRFAIWQRRRTTMKLLQAHKDQATVSVRQHLRSKVRNMSTNGTYLLTVETRGEDLWTKSPDGWKLKRSTVFSSSYGTKILDKGETEEKPRVRIGGGG